LVATRPQWIVTNWLRGSGIYFKGGDDDQSIERSATIFKGVNLSMQEPDLTPIGLDDEFCFACHSKVPCFNHCCRDLNQALTPFDVLRLKNHLNISSQEFVHSYAVIYQGPATGLPVMSLRFSPDKAKSCPFATPDGCKVYESRPSSCRIYPLARALQRSRVDGGLTEHYAVLREPHCRGFQQQTKQTVRQWISSQGLGIYNKMNDAMMEIIAMKNQVRPGELSAEHQGLTRMAFYHLDILTEKALAGRLPHTNTGHITPLPDEKNDVAWLAWSLNWIAQVLFGNRFNLSL
jgi:Fe-S-cluster containining protein